MSSLSEWFILSSGVLFAITGIAKLWSGMGNSKALLEADPIFALKLGKLMLAVGVVELVIALVCFLQRQQVFVLGVVAWISTSFVAYRIGLWSLDWHGPCSCLGNVADALHISPQVADNIMKVALVYLLTGSYCLIIREWMQCRQSIGVKKAGQAAGWQ